jgi:hypothetical protein
MLVLAVLASCGSYAYHVYSLFRDAQRNMPQPKIDKLMKDFRLFHSRTKRLPRNFAEINDYLWHTRPMPDYGAEGRQARVKNYYYFYTRVNDERCAIWAVPLGPQRGYVSSFFVVISPEWTRKWEGKALEDGLITRLPAIPTLDGLAKLRMIEYPVTNRR